MERGPHMMKNTSHSYPCVMCGADQGNIIREAASDDERRVKCMSCGFTYSARDSLEAVESGTIPTDAKPVPPAPATQVERPRSDGEVPYAEAAVNDRSEQSISEVTGTAASVIPRAPAYVFIAKNRNIMEFCTKRNFKKVALKWESRSTTFDLFELHSKKSTVKVSVE